MNRGKRPWQGRRRRQNRGRIPARKPAAQKSAVQKSAKQERAEPKPAKDKQADKKPAQEKPPADGPVNVQVAPAEGDVMEEGTDLDSEEQDAFREEVQAIEDRGLFNRPEEMFAYNRIVRWVQRQPFDVMRQRAKTDVLFNDFVQSPNQWRGKLFELKLNARLVREYAEKTQDGVQLHEVWGFTTDSGSWVYAAVVVDLPAGMPVGERVDEEVRFVGYFLKLQGYQPKGAKPNSRPLFAPLLIGRIRRIQLPPQAANDWEWLESLPAEFGSYWGVALTVGLTLVIGLALIGLLVYRRRPKRKRSPLETRAAGPVPMDDWFDRIAPPAGSAPEEEGNSDDEKSPPSGNGHRATGLFGDAMDVDRRDGE